MNPDEPDVWCSQHPEGKCALARRARKLYLAAKAGQAAIVLQARVRWGASDPQVHTVVCTGGEQGEDQGWIQDVVRYPWDMV